MAYAYKNLVTPKNVASGIADFIYLAPVVDFAADGIKCPEAPFTNPGDEVTVATDHEFLATKGFVKVLLAPEKNQLTGKTIGDKGFAKLDVELDVFFPGSYPVVHEFVKNVINTPLIVLVKDSECSEEMYYQLGCDCIYAYMSVDFSTGTTKDGNKGYNGKITYQTSSILIYKGEITTVA